MSAKVTYRDFISVVTFCHFTEVTVLIVAHDIAAN